MSPTTVSSLRRAAAALSLAVVPSLVLAGCGDNGGGTATPTTAVEASSGTARSASTTASRKSTTTDTDEPTDTTETTETTETTDTTDTTDPTDPVALPDACDLLTQEDVEAAFGQPVVAGEQRVDECWWSTANDLKIVNLIRRSDDLDEWRAGYDNDSWDPVDRGDEGYAGRILSSIVWRIGDVQYEVNVNFSTKGEPDEVVNELADKVLARLDP